MRKIVNAEVFCDDEKRKMTVWRRCENPRRAEEPEEEEEEDDDDDEKQKMTVGGFARIRE